MVREVSESCVESLLTEIVSSYCNGFYADKPELAARRIEAIGFQVVQNFTRQSLLIFTPNSRINALALPDFSKISIIAKPSKDTSAPPQPVAGILKRDWLLKRRTRVPAVVAALFSSNHVSGDPAQWLQVCTDLENLKYTMDRPRFTDHLEAIKFICKDFWSEVFKKQIDNLKTNHRGTFVLQDNRFRWLSRMSVDPSIETLGSIQDPSAMAENKAAQAIGMHLYFPCGIIRGALSNLGIPCAVSADISNLPACSFVIRIKA